MASQGPRGGNRLGPYEIHEELGRGGQGTVYRATDTRLGRAVALKVLERAGPLGEEVLERFRREAAAAARLDHPNVCAVYEAGTDGGVPFIAMRLVEGESLAARLARSSRFLHALSDSTLGHDGASAPGTAAAEQAPPPDRHEIASLTQLFAKAARGLHAIHEGGIIHRDLKPANITVTPAGDPVIMDFGLAHDETAEQTLTRTGDLFGTPAYMSPEQLTRHAIRLDRRSDVWSLGAVLYELLTLRRPFEAPTREQLYQAILSKEPADPRQMNPAITKDLAAIVETTLQKDLDRRYQTAAALADDLEAYAAGNPVRARRVGPIGRLRRWSGRNPALAGFIALTMVGLPTITILGVNHVANRQKLEEAEKTRVRGEQEELLSKASFELGEKDPDRAILLFEQARALGGDLPEAIAGIAMAHVKQKRPAEALAVLDQNPTTLSGRRAAWLLRQSALEDLGRNAEAAAASRSAPEPRDAIDFFLEGMRLIEVGHAGNKAAFTEATTNLRMAIVLASPPRALFFQQCAHAAGHGNDTLTARQMAYALQHMWPDSAASGFWAGFALLEANRLDEAIATLRRCLTLNPDNPASVRFNLAKAFEKKAVRDAAISELKEVVRIEPTFATAWFDLGVHLEAAGRRDEAIAAMRSAITANPLSATAHAGLGTLLERDRKFDDAVSEYREAIRLEPTDEASHQSLVVTLRKKGALDEAIDAARESIKALPMSAKRRSALGVALRAGRRFEEAAAAQREAVMIDPQLADAWFELGRSLDDAGVLADAMAAYRKALTLDSDLKEAHCNLGGILAKCGSFDEALAAQREAIRRDPGFVGAFENMALTLHEAGRFTEAHDATRRAIELAATRRSNRSPFGLREQLEAASRIERELPAIEQQWSSIGDLDMMLMTADVASFKQRWQLAARLYSAAAQQEPRIIETFESVSLRGARAFIQTARLAGVDSRTTIPDDEREQWRQRALLWLQDLVRKQRDILEAGDEKKEGARTMLSVLLADKFLGPVRDEADIEKLPPAEASAWRALWASVRELIRG